MMANVPHVTSGLGLRKFQADGFLLTRMYIDHTKNTSLTTIYQQQIFQPTHKAILLLCLILNMYISHLNFILILFYTELPRIF